MVVRSPIRFPYTRPVFPRISSATSGFFFCGIILLPVLYPSSKSIKWNSWLLQIIISSHIRLKCILQIEAAAIYSKMKSRSLTPSIEFRQTESNPNSSATCSRSSGNVVPASAPEPNGKTFIRTLQSSKRVISRLNISA